MANRAASAARAARGALSRRQSSPPPRRRSRTRDLRAASRARPATLDELHGVVVHPPVAPDGEDRHDVGMVQGRRDLGLDPEPRELPGVHDGRHRQDLQGDATPERHLLGLVDDPHPATADLADDAELAQGGRTMPARGAGHGLQQLQAREGPRGARWRPADIAGRNRRRRGSRPARVARGTRRPPGPRATRCRGVRSMRCRSVLSVHR